MLDGKSSETPFATRVFSVLDLKTFSEDELHASFDRLDENHDDTIDKEELRSAIRSIHKGGNTSEIDDFVDVLYDYEIKGQKEAAGGITYPQFRERTKQLAESLDPRVKPMTAMFLCSGMSIGIIIPIMPQLVQALEISSSEYGLIVGAFAGAKMFANVPTASLVDRFGRKPIITGGMMVVGASLGCIGLASAYTHIMLCRAFTGIGVAAFVTGATMYLSDISTPLNRAKTMAPPNVAFGAGTAVGPAIGGILSDTIGISGSFFLVGGSFGLIAIANQAIMPESAQDKPLSVEGADSKETQSTFDQWKELLQDSRIVNMILLNSGYWFVLSGSQLTLLPLMLVGEQFQLSASAIGGIFAASSVVGVIFTPLAAKLLDKVGQVQCIVPACFAIGSSMAFVPLAGHNIMAFLSLFGIWTAAGTLLGAGPTTYLSNITEGSARTQALALSRTGGDIGMFGGAICSGMLATVAGQPEAVMANGIGFIGLSSFAAWRLWRTAKNL